MKADDHAEGADGGDRSLYNYERGDGRHKHRWKRDEAGFREEHGRVVGKCHASIDQPTAQRLLHGGIPEPPLLEVSVTPAREYPERIFNVYRGVPYVAVPTRPGISYHGFPWRGRLHPQVRDTLARRARAAGHDDEKVFRKWLKEHGEG